MKKGKIRKTEKKTGSDFDDEFLLSDKKIWGDSFDRENQVLVEIMDYLRWLFPPEDDEDIVEHSNELWDSLTAKDNDEFIREIINKTFEIKWLAFAVFIYKNCPDMVPQDMKDEFLAFITMESLVPTGTNFPG